ncbi:hypothetical protein PAXRUDRAFT_26678 [Paxillus rubicundulus Ve08.2h10]|uniref:Uncharacterized protein n=1 Tax=Paxillus rubicundulus Ve08.2h10 TaxID=930991 RepID=A0A0D0E556_9AGAM|nr:hypothetical protein PAXRUDRAFT_26678 [Paxillus rubicundulus Ve08.2h10]
MKVHPQQGTHSQGGWSMRKLNENMQEILLYTCAAIVNKMVLNLGWCKGKEWHQWCIKIACKCFTQAVATLRKLHEENTCTKLMASIIERELSIVRGRLIEAAKKLPGSDDPHHKYLSEAYPEWVQAHVETILNASDTMNFVLHEHDGKASPVHH